MRICPSRRIGVAAVASAAAALSASSVLRATDLRFDVSTSNNGVLLPNLAFPSANGHFGLLGGSTYESTLTAKGNTLAIYYNNFNANNPFSTYPNPHDMAVAIQSYVNSLWTTPGSNSGWIALNEVSSSNWQNNPTNSFGIDYHTWCIDVVALLKNGDNSDPSNIVPAHTGVILWAPFGTPGTTNRASWQAIAQYAYIGDERYIDGATVQAGGYSVSAVQSFYQDSYNAWVNNAGVPANRLILTEEYTNSLAGNGYGANGTSGEAWQAAIETRNLAARNVGFGGYAGYAWSKNAQGSSNDTLISYENAYASTMVLQTEVPCWTGNDAGVTGNTWSDYLNWTGGLPSTTQFPYDALLNNSNNTGLIPHQTAANFLSNANTSAAGTTITLDGNQSITTMSFNSANPYTIAPGTGGTLTLAGSNSSITVANGSHSIAAGLQLVNNVAANLTGGNLTLSGNLSTNGNTLTKTGPGTLTISGPQNHASGSAISVQTGTLNLNSDAGSAGNQVLALSAANAGTIVNLNATQHLASLGISSGAAVTVPAGMNKTLTVNSLSITGPSTLDLNDNTMIVNYAASDTTHSVRDSIRNLLVNGRNGGAGQPGSWNGLGGIVSTFAHANGNGFNLAIGYADNADLATVRGSGSYTSFGGQTVASNTILVELTRGADATLDGVVDAQDVTILGSHFNKPNSGQWCFGDFDYSGTCDATDVTTLGSTFGKTTPTLSPAQMTAEFGAAFMQAFESGDRGAASVPEPTAGLILLALLPGAARGERRRKRKAQREI